MLVRLLCSIALLLLASCGGPAPAPPAPAAQGTPPPETESPFPKAAGPRSFNFPRDHGQHPEYETEWWYYTGTLQTAVGRPFGVQITFFRRALAPLPAERASLWNTRDIYLAHFCIADLLTGEFHQMERIARGAAGLAMASPMEHHLQLLDWTITPTEHGVAFRLADREQNIALEAFSSTRAPIVLHGREPGWSWKTGPQQASYYYSIPRMRTEARLVLQEEIHDLLGDLWMDHEWGSSQLSAAQQGWDWFALQLDDGGAVMLFQIRMTDPAQPAAYSGTWIPAPSRDDPTAFSGPPVHLEAGDFTLEPLDWWTSPVTGARYPVRWRITIPGQGFAGEVRARMPNQELETSATTNITYWEGSVAVTGSHPGTGYMELTGYVENVGERFR